MLEGAIVGGRIPELAILQGTTLGGPILEGAILEGVILGIPVTEAPVFGLGCSNLNRVRHVTVPKGLRDDLSARLWVRFPVALAGLIGIPSPDMV
jgi:hypothetical protein